MTSPCRRRDDAGRTDAPSIDGVARGAARAMISFTFVCARNSGAAAKASCPRTARRRRNLARPQASPQTPAAVSRQADRSPAHAADDPACSCNNRETWSHRSPPRPPRRPRKTNPRGSIDPALHPLVTNVFVRRPCLPASAILASYVKSSMALAVEILLSQGACCSGRKRRRSGPRRGSSVACDCGRRRH